MQDGTWTYYQLQHRLTHESPWLKPQDPLHRVKDKDWSGSSWDYFGHVAEPWIGKGNERRPQFRRSHDETHEVWSATSHRGWWTLKYAIRGLKRLRAANLEGTFDSRGNYGEHCQASRYEFRIIRVTVSKETEIVTCEQMLEAVT